MLKRSSLLMIVSVAVGLWTGATVTAQDKTDKIKVLIIDGQNNHNWRATTPFMKKALEDTGRFTVEVATTPEAVKAPAKPKEPQKLKDETEKAQAEYKLALEKYKKALVNYEEGLARFKGEVYPTYRKQMEAFHPDLTKYQVVLSNYNGDKWGAAFSKDFEDTIRAGKVHLVIVHAANNSFGGWKEYDQMIGMGWRGNTYGDRLIVDDAGKEIRLPKGKGFGAGHGSQHAFKIVVRDRSHPITKGMPAEWMHAQDELYQGMRGPIENVHLLATAYADKAKGGKSSSNEHEPMIWTVSYGKARVFHTPMGHDLAGMRCIGFITTLARGTEWAATGQVTLPIPTNFPTAENVSQVK